MPLAGLAGEGSEARKSGNLFAAELSELGQFCDQGSCDDRPNAGHGREEIFLLSPNR